MRVSVPIGELIALVSQRTLEVRLQWAFEFACKDPEFRFGLQCFFKHKEDKNFPLFLYIIRVYEVATDRKLLTETERAVAEYWWG